MLACTLPLSPARTCRRRRPCSYATPGRGCTSAFQQQSLPRLARPPARLAALPAWLPSATFGLPFIAAGEGVGIGRVQSVSGSTAGWQFHTAFYTPLDIYARAYHYQLQLLVLRPHQAWFIQACLTDRQSNCLSSNHMDVYLPDVIELSPFTSVNQHFGYLPLR